MEYGLDILLCNEVMEMVPANEALERLKAGNERFVADRCSSDAITNSKRRHDTAERQDPIAIILGCSDSRVPAEIVFDQGLGDLFVIRVAGNVVAPSQIGSIEFAVEQFGTQLVVVLGHSHCGAVAATLEQLQHPKAYRSANLHSLVDRIRPSVETLLETDLQDHPEALLHFSVRANIRMAVNQLRRGSPILERLVNDDRLKVVGASYSLETGCVEFL